MNWLDDVKAVFSHHAYSIGETLKGMHQTLADVERNTRSEENLEVLGRENGTATSPASGIVEMELELPPGYACRVLRVAVTQAKAGVVLVYQDMIHPANLIAGPYTGTSSENLKIFIPRNGSLVFHFIEQGAGQVVGANVQYERLMRSPNAEAIQNGDASPMLLQPTKDTVLQG